MGLRRKKWLESYSIGIFLVVWMGCLKFYQPIERIGCFPVFEKDGSPDSSWPVASSADILSEHLRVCFSSRSYVYPVHSLLNMIEQDSVSFSSYRVRCAKQLRLDWFITVSLDSSLSRVALRGYRFNQNKEEKLSFHVETPIYAWNKAVLSVIDTLTKCEKTPHSCLFKLPSENIYFWKTYGKAILYYWQEKFEKADSVFQSVLSFAPQWERARLLRVEVLLQRTNFSAGLPKGYFYAQSDTLLHFLESKKKSDYRVQWLRGKWYLQQERWHAAELSLVSAYKQYPRDPLLWMDISRLHPSRFQKLGFSDRISIYEKVLKTDPTCEPAWISLTGAFLHQGKLNAVENLCKKWLSIFPRSLDAWFTLAKVFALRNDFIQITKIYRELVKWYPDKPEVYYNLGVLYFQSHRFSEAKAFFLESLQRNGSPDAYFYLGLIYENLHQPEKAIQAYQKRIAFRQSSADRYADQARIRLQVLLAKHESS